MSLSAYYICYRRVIWIDELCEIADRIILIPTDFAVGIGAACDTVQSIIGSRSRAGTVSDDQNVSVCIVGIACGAFGGGEACDSSLGIIEELSYLSTGVCELLAKIQLVVCIGLCSARFKNTHTSK